MRNVDFCTSQIYWGIRLSSGGRHGRSGWDDRDGCEAGLAGSNFVSEMDQGGVEEARASLRASPLLGVSRLTARGVGGFIFIRSRHWCGLLGGDSWWRSGGVSM